MIKFTSVLMAIALLASLTACGNGASSTSDAENSVLSDKPLVSAPVSNPPEQIQLPEDQELAAMITVLREANAKEANVSWDSTGGPFEKLRITGELLSGIADILAAEPYERDERVIQGAFDSDANLSVSFPVQDFPDERDSENFTVYLLSDDLRNEEYAGKIILSFNGLSGDGLQYSYPKSSYDKLALLLEAFKSTATVSLEGSYTPLESGYISDVNFGPANVLEFDDTLVCLWQIYGDTQRGAVEAVDTKTGASLYHLDFAEKPELIEKISASPYDYRVRYSGRIEYRSSGDKNQVETYEPPADILGKLWIPDDMSFKLPFDADLNAKLLAYSAEDGVYLCGLDGGSPRQVLSNSDIPNILKGSELPEHEDSQLKYTMPLLLNGGKQLVSTIYLMTNGNYDGAPFSMTIVDLASGEKQHRTDIVWISFPVMRLDDKTVGYLGSGEKSGYYVVDVETAQTRIADINFHEADSFDYSTVAQTEESRDNSGETISTLYTYHIDKPDEKAVLLTVKSGSLRIWKVTEHYIICVYGDGQADGTRRIVAVPYQR